MWRRWLLVLLVAALIIAVITGAEIFSLASESNPQRPSNSHNQYQPVYASLVELLLGGWRWVLDRIDHDTLTTIAIAATAVFTGTLWAATRNLGHFAEAQAAEMQSLLRAARDNTGAAVSQAEAMRQLHAAAEAQERAMRDHVEATRGLTQHIPQIERAYISGGGSKHMMTMRASGTVGAYQIRQGEMIQVYSGHFQLEINNHGKTPGHLFQYSIMFCDADSLPETPIYQWINWLDWI